MYRYVKGKNDEGDLLYGKWIECILTNLNIKFFISSLYSLHIKLCTWKIPWISYILVFGLKYC